MYTFNLSLVFLLILIAGVTFLNSVVQVPDQQERQQHSDRTRLQHIRLRPIPGEYTRVTVGDSIIRNLRPPLGARIIPAGGATAGSLWNRVREEIATLGHIHGLAIMVGTNDIGRGISLREFETQYKGMVRNFQHLRPDVVWLVNILPRPGDRLPVRRHNAIVSEIAERRGCCYVNVHRSFTDPLGAPKAQFFRRDGLHLNQAGSNRLFDIMASNLNDRMLAMRLQ